MKKTIIALLLIAFTISSTYASGSKDKKGTDKGKEVNLSVHIDKDGNVEINGKGISEKDIEKWVEEHLNNLSINIDSDSDEDAAAPQAKEVHEKVCIGKKAPRANGKDNDNDSVAPAAKQKTINISITVGEK